MIAGINKSKILTKHISCKCKCNFDARKCNSIESRNMINVDVGAKNITYLKNIWNPTTCSCKNGKYLASIIDDDSEIKHDEIIQETKTISINLNEKTATCKIQNFYILLHMIKYKSKQKYLLLYYVTNNKLII